MVLPQAMAWVQYWFRVLSLKFCGKSQKNCGDILQVSPAFCMYGLKLSGQCRYRTNTFQNGTSLMKGREVGPEFFSWIEYFFEIGGFGVCCLAWMRKRLKNVWFWIQGAGITTMTLTFPNSEFSYEMKNSRRMVHFGAEGPVENTHYLLDSDLK